MTRSNESDDTDLDKFHLADFIEDRSELFVVMGVFGALAIYIAQSTDELGTSTDAELMTTVGFVSAFALSILMLSLVYSKLIEEFGNWNKLYRAHFRVRNAPLALFSLLSLVLVISISHILTRHEPVVFMLVLVATYAAGVGVVMRIVFGVARRVPRTPTWRISTIVTACLVTLLSTMYLHENILDQIEITTIHELSFSDPVTIVMNVAFLLVVTIESFAALGILATLIGIPFIIVDKIRGVSPYDRAR